MTVLVKILQFAIKHGEKVAVFSQSLATLDIIQVITSLLPVPVGYSLTSPPIAVTAQLVERTPELDCILQLLADRW